MASYTTNLNLKKPSGSEAVAIGDINGNMDTIDTAYGTLNGNIQALAGLISRVDCSQSIETFAESVAAGSLQYFRMRNSEPASSWNYSVGIIFSPTSSEKIIVMFHRESSQIIMKSKFNDTWTGWKAVGLT